MNQFKFPLAFHDPTIHPWLLRLSMADLLGDSSSLAPGLCLASERKARECVIGCAPAYVGYFWLL